MYRGHLSIDVQKLLYQQVDADVSGRRTCPFVLSQDRRASHPPPPSFETHSNKHFNLAKRYHDTESDHVEYVGRRDYRETYNSDASNPGVNDYQSNGTYKYRQ